ncbi:MAG TPA: tetratricopeptide repeat protein [Candidatus Binatia bacterium]
MSLPRPHPDANLRRLIDLLEVGDLAGVDRHVARFDDMAVMQPEYQRHALALRAMRALLTGRLADAEAAIEEAFELGRRAQAPDAALVHMLQLFVLCREQNRLDEAEAALRATLERHPANRSLQTGLALLLAETHREDEARKCLDRLAANAFAAIPRAANDVNALDQIARACHVLGDAARARQLYDRLVPYAARNVVVGLAYACTGPVAGTLGLLATTCRRFDLAEAHFEAALTMGHRLSSPPCIAHVERAYGAMLLEHGVEDTNRAAGLLDDAIAIYAALGMRAHVARTQVLRPRSARARDRRVAMRRAGADWIVTFDGRELRAADGAGLRHLAQLVRQPGRAFHAVDLAGAARLEAPERASSPAERTRLARRQRLAELRMDLEEARRADDDHRAAALQAELDTVVTELARADALGLEDGVEAVVRSVAAALRDAISGFVEDHAALGRHLHDTLRLGAFCMYAPEGGDVGRDAHPRPRLVSEDT